MSMNDDTREQPDGLADDNQETVAVTDLILGSDGRITIPKDTRERYDIEEGDYLDAVLVLDDKQ